MAYVYRHIRLDKQEVFYVGIGSDEKYERSKTTKNRNKYWHNIVKSTAYEVEIMLDDLTWEEACEKEKEFIKLYGRKDLKEGTLVNMTDGGEGAFGVIMSEETREKRRLSMPDFSGKNNPMYGKKRDDSWCRGLTKETDDRVRTISEKLKNFVKSEDHCNNISKAKKGKPNPKAKGDLNPAKRAEVRDKISKAQKGNKYREGVKHSEETKKLLRQRALERDHPLHTEETKAKMRETALKRKKVECPYCKKSYDLGNLKKSHGENCKHKTN
jgi:hypothetical protein